MIPLLLYLVGFGGVLLVSFLFLGGLTWLLSYGLTSLAGLSLIVMAGVSYVKNPKAQNKYLKWIIILGLFLLLDPLNIVSSAFGNLTIVSIMGG